MERNKIVIYLTKILVLLKNWFFLLSSMVLSFLVPIQPIIIVTTMVAFFDWFLKLYCVYKTEGKGGIKSDKIQDTFFKIILYAAFIITCFTIDQLFFKTLCYDLFFLLFDESTAQWLTKVQLSIVGALMILVRETKSIDENWESAFGISPIDLINKHFGWLFQWRKSF